MGDVYRAHDLHLNRDIAIKVLPAGMLEDESARKHFHKEALALSRLNHPNIATIYDFDTERGLDFLVMELIPGITLSDKLALGPQPEKVLPPADLVGIATVPLTPEHTYEEFTRGMRPAPHTRTRTNADAQHS